MDKDKVHQGQYRQGGTADDVERNARPAVTPGVNPDLHADSIANPAEQPERNLHGDDPDSPYAPPAVADVARDEAETREREIESRQTGVPTEVLAAEDEGDKEPEPKPKPKASDKK